MMEWITYAETRPTVAGPYAWRVPSVVLTDLIVTCVAHMRMRGAGFEEVLSPVFDHWDGYNVHVPAGLQWRETRSHREIEWHETVEITPEGVTLTACPYCLTIPRWQSMVATSGGGVLVSSKPHRMNTWWLECCDWAKTPRYRDPRDLASFRNRRLALAGLPMP